MRMNVFLVLCFILNGSIRQASAKTDPVNIKDKEQETICLDNNKFCFQIKHDSKNDAELFKVLHAYNDKLIYVTGINYAKTGDLFTVSKYIAEEKISSDSAFKIAIESEAFADDGNNLGYKLIDYGKYKKEGKVLRFKISNPVGDAHNVYCIMYYFMENDLSNTQYEIKATCKKENMAICKNFLENIALSVVLK